MSGQKFETPKGRIESLPGALDRGAYLTMSAPVRHHFSCEGGDCDGIECHPALREMAAAYSKEEFCCDNCDLPTSVSIEGLCASCWVEHERAADSELEDV